MLTLSNSNRSKNENPRTRGTKGKRKKYKLEGIQARRVKQTTRGRTRNTRGIVDVHRGKSICLFTREQIPHRIRKYGFRFPSPGFIAVHEVASGSKATLTISPRRSIPVPTPFRLAGNGFPGKSIHRFHRLNAQSFIHRDEDESNFRRGEGEIIVIVTIDRFGRELGFGMEFYGGENRSAPLSFPKEFHRIVGNARWWRGIVFEEMSATSVGYLTSLSQFFTEEYIRGVRAPAFDISCYFLGKIWLGRGAHLISPTISDYK